MGFCFLCLENWCYSFTFQWGMPSYIGEKEMMTSYKKSSFVTDGLELRR